MLLSHPARLALTPSSPEPCHQTGALGAGQRCAAVPPGPAADAGWMQGRVSSCAQGPGPAPGEATIALLIAEEGSCVGANPVRSQHDNWYRPRQSFRSEPIPCGATPCVALRRRPRRVEKACDQPPSTVESRHRAAAPATGGGRGATADRAGLGLPRAPRSRPARPIAHPHRRAERWLPRDRPLHPRSALCIIQGHIPTEPSATRQSLREPGRDDALGVDS